MMKSGLRISSLPVVKIRAIDLISVVNIEMILPFWELSFSFDTLSPMANQSW